MTISLIVPLMMVISVLPINQKADKAVQSYLKEGAKEIARAVPIGARVTVLEFEFSGNVASNNLNSRITEDFISEFSRRKGGDFCLIDRLAGEKIWRENRIWSPMSTSDEGLRKVLEGFRADCAVICDYRFDGRGLYLGPMKLVKAPDAGNSPVIIISYKESGMIPLADGDSAALTLLSECLQPLIDAEIMALFHKQGKGGGLRIELQHLDNTPYLESLPVVPIDSSFRIMARLQAPAYIYVVSYDSTNKYVSLLFPSQYEPNNRVLAGDFLLPRDSALGFKAVAPGGYNIIKVIAVREKLDWRPEYMSEPFLKKESIDSLKLVLDRLRPENWISDNYETWIK